MRDCTQPPSPTLDRTTDGMRGVGGAGDLGLVTSRTAIFEASYGAMPCPEIFAVRMVLACEGNEIRGVPRS